MEEKDQDHNDVINSQDQINGNHDTNSNNNNGKVKLNGTPKIEIFPSSCLIKENPAEKVPDTASNAQKSGYNQ